MSDNPQNGKESMSNKSNRSAVSEYVGLIVGMLGVSGGDRAAVSFKQIASAATGTWSGVTFDLTLKNVIALRGKIVSSLRKGRTRRHKVNGLRVVDILRHPLQVIPVTPEYFSSEDRVRSLESEIETGDEEQVQVAVRSLSNLYASKLTGQADGIAIVRSDGRNAALGQIYGAFTGKSGNGKIVKALERESETRKILPSGLEIESASGVIARGLAGAVSDPDMKRALASSLRDAVLMLEEAEE